MTALFIYSIIVTGILVAICYHKFFGKGKINSQELEKKIAENEVLRIENAQNFKKLQEAFSGKVKMDSVDTIVSSYGSSRKRHKRRPRKDNE